MMESVLINALDDITSSRSSAGRRSRAFGTLERLLADLCGQLASPSSPGGVDHGLTEFKRLQDAFETNIATRLISFLTTSLPQLESLSSTSSSPSLSTPPTPSRGHSRSHSHSHSPQPEAASLSASIIQALQLLQGCCFLHEPSKTYLGRKAPLQLLLDILLISRPHHVSSSSISGTGSGLGVSSLSIASTTLSVNDNRIPSSNYPNPSTAPSPVPLSPLEGPGTPTPLPGPSVSTIALAVLDTLLVILVDSPRALRAFEDASGLESIVRTLKRAGVPRDVRMRCLEFLYFYLLPETPESPLKSPTNRAATPDPHQQQDHQTRAHTPPSPFLAPSSGSVSRRSSPLSRAETPLPAVPDLHAVPPLSSSRSSSASSAWSLETSASLSTSSAPSTAPPVPAQLRSGLTASAALSAVARLKAEEELSHFIPSTPKKAKVARIGMGTPGPRLPGAANSSLPGSREGSGSSARGVPASSVKERERAKESVLGAGAGVGGVPALSLTTPSKSSSRDNSPGMRGLGLDLSLPLSEGDTTLRPAAQLDVTLGPGAGAGVGGVVRSTEEKRERLGAWLGNVDQLVEGVRRAGVWGVS